MRSLVHYLSIDQTEPSAAANEPSVHHNVLVTFFKLLRLCLTQRTPFSNETVTRYMGDARGSEDVVSGVEKCPACRSIRVLPLVLAIGISSLCLYWHVTCAKEFTDPAIKPTMSLMKNRQQRSPQHQTTVNYIVPKREQYQRTTGDGAQIKLSSMIVDDVPKSSNPLPKRELIHHAVPNITQARIEQIIQNMLIEQQERNKPTPVQRARLTLETCYYLFLSVLPVLVCMEVCLLLLHYRYVQCQFLYVLDSARDVLTVAKIVPVPVLMFLLLFKEIYPRVYLDHLPSWFLAYVLYHVVVFLVFVPILFFFPHGKLEHVFPAKNTGHVCSLAVDVRHKTSVVGHKTSVITRGL